ncbi:MAG: OmpA family protein [Bacteroidetes bacterium]|nr:OmpA family protein [Bacteroidota bacterium]
MPKHFSTRCSLLVLVLGIPFLLPAQVPLTLLAQGTKDSIIVSASEGTGAGPAAFTAFWTGVDGPSARFDLRPAAGAGGDAALNDLIIAGAEQYLDQRVHFTREGVRVDLPVPLLCSGIDKMIALAASRFGAPVPALSPATREQMGRVSRIDWSKASFGVDGGEDQEKYLAIYYYVRAQRQELERQMRNDLISLAGIQVLAREPEVRADAGKNDTVPTVCSTVFDDQNYLCALDLTVGEALPLQDVHLTDAMLADIAAKAESAAAPALPEPKLRKRDRWLKAELDAINKRIDQMDQRKELWALRDRMDDMDDRISDIGMQVDELKAGRGSGRVTENPLANLSMLTGKDLSVQFAAGSAEVGGDGRKLLDEVVRVMGQTPESRLLVTGFADQSGDASLNLLLSERRAKAVRSYLLARGIGPERVLLNYFGARNSTGVNAAERRVELEWVR